jgi:N-acetylglutamate synthase-like GNAT family acetyltransferase
MDFAIEPGNWTDLPAIRGLLIEAGLPVEDLATCPVQFRVARTGGALAGAIGLEPYGDTGLLRSLVVAPAVRGTGVGKALVAALEGEARRSGVSRLVLLTETAAAFFEHIGYSVAERKKVGGMVSQSAQFLTCCPTSATCMTKTLT